MPIFYSECQVQIIYVCGARNILELENNLKLGQKAEFQVQDLPKDNDPS